ncbi:MAG: alpha-D-glucose phosphate-specific phosphoglucomutase [Ferrovibrio sp.]|uniref:alpha-D-glucose phosphate-specific phosphoglucomutase n=1 Tax=Ferrovibrio sp. TaxID=1917215 RepID=UPI0026330ABB|nr:alpha-D-glucose phosphate-specific phosphoglucomutase [Ferrovibrio sp.]MCW0235439.1 alpha-D-glucose phosphate-specific phosphoglucomutase [Ferrovibrio sp.]
MSLREVAIAPFEGQKPGTSGLRKKVTVFQQPGYLEAFVQAVFDTAPELQGGTLVLGGDGRFFNREAIATILRLAAANGIDRVLVGQRGILSTPAASAVIRRHRARGGLVLSASHNPGGPDGDFGIKYNIANGGPAPEAVTEAIFKRTQTIGRYRILDAMDVKGVTMPSSVSERMLDQWIDQVGEYRLGGMTVQVIDPVEDYAAVVGALFDFDAIRRLIARPGFRFRFDAMHAVTGPYARRLLVDMLGAPATSVINAEPKEDFGGGHPDPNPAHAPELYQAVVVDGTLDFAAASDGDGDRNMILGKGIAVSPSDSLAVLAANATLVPGYARGISGVARSMPTSRASDAVAAALKVESFETPTGWKFFGTLLDAGRITLCGEESYGTSSDHVREKDGLWAVLFWLNLLAAKPGETVLSILQAHWRRFGRHYYSRHDYEAVDAKQAAAALDRLRAALPGLPGEKIGALAITAADDFAYRDPVDGSESRGQGLRVICGEQARVIARLSGTGTEGATVRLYFELFESDPARQNDDVQSRLQPLIDFAEVRTGLREITGRTAPDVIT